MCDGTCSKATVSLPAAKMPCLLSHCAPGFFRAGTAHGGPSSTGDEARRVVPKIAPAGADQRNAAFLRSHSAGREMLRSHDEIERQSIDTFEPRNIEQHRRAENRLDGIDAVRGHAFAVGLDRLHSAVQFSVAGEMGERVDVRAHVAAHSDRLGGGACAVRQHQFAMHVWSTCEETADASENGASRRREAAPDRNVFPMFMSSFFRALARARPKRRRSCRSNVPGEIRGRSAR